MLFDIQSNRIYGGNWEIVPNTRTQEIGSQQIVCLHSSTIQSNSKKQLLTTNGNPIVNFYNFNYWLCGTTKIRYSITFQHHAFYGMCCSFALKLQNKT